MKKNNYLDIFKLKGKFSYGKSFLDYKYDGVLFPKVSLNKEYAEGIEITKIGDELDILTLHYKGELKVSTGQEIKEGKEIALSGKLRKKYLTSPVSGRIVDIDEDKKIISLEYSVLSDEKRASFKPTLMPFRSKIVKKLPRKIILESEAFTINLFALKGSDAIGLFKYLDAKDFTNEDFPIDAKDVKDAIIFTETITPEQAARLSAQGVNGIIVNTLDFSVYSAIMTLSMPVGIISGFDKEKIIMEKDLKSYFKNLENSKVVIDSVYNKLHILNNLKPDWLD